MGKLGLTGSSSGYRSGFPAQRPYALLDLGRFLEHHTEPALLLGPDGEQVPLPEEVYRVVVEVVQAMREGKAVAPGFADGILRHTAGDCLLSTSSYRLS